MGTAEFAALGTALVGCVTDVRSHRIPNVLTLGAAAAAILFHLSQGGTAALWALAGWIVALAIFLPFFYLGGMGGGDVKLMAALGAWLGPGQAVSIALWTSIAGGVMAVALALSTGYLLRAFHNMWALVGYWRHAGLKPHPVFTLHVAGTPRLPYALPIGAGLMVTLWLR